MLNITEGELELISEADMYFFFKKRIKRGVLYIFKRCSNATNKYLKSYDPKQKSKHIIYLDENNLYGYGMSKFPPTCGFKWIDPQDFFQINLITIVQRGLLPELNHDYPSIP